MHAFMLDVSYTWGDEQNALSAFNQYEHGLMQEYMPSSASIWQWKLKAKGYDGSSCYQLFRIKHVTIKVGFVCVCVGAILNSQRVQ